MLLFLKSCQAEPQPAIFSRLEDKRLMQQASVCPSILTRLSQACQQQGDLLKMRIYLGHSPTPASTSAPETLDWLPSAPRIKTKHSTGHESFHIWPLPASPTTSLAHTCTHARCTPAHWPCCLPSALCCTASSPCVIDRLL